MSALYGGGGVYVHDVPPAASGSISVPHGISHSQLFDWPIATLVPPTEVTHGLEVG